MKLLVALALAALIVGTAACGGSDETDPAAQGETTEEDTSEEEAGGEVTISSTEYKFDIPATLPAGPTTFTLDNVGKEPHFIQIVELQEGAPPVPKLIKLPEKKAESFFVRIVAATKPVQPGQQSEPFDAELTPGRYGYVCFFSAKGQPPHAFLGMNGEFTVE